MNKLVGQLRSRHRPCFHDASALCRAGLSLSHHRSPFDAGRPRNVSQVDHSRRLTITAAMSHRSSSPYLFEINVQQWMRSEQGRRPFPFITEPHEVACFSKDENGSRTVASRTKLRKYVAPAANADLNAGYDSFIPKRHDDTCVSNIINVVRTQNQQAFADCDIITYRNNLNKISRTPLASRDEWEFDCCQFADSKVALDIRMTQPDPPIGVAGQATAHTMAMYQGYKFEALCTGDNEAVPVDANAEFCSIAMVKLARHRMIVSSEIDATFGDPSATGSGAIRDYVELKTIKSVRHDGDLNSLYRYRYPKFWFQSFIAGVPSIVIGYRAPDGMLTHTSTISTFDMPSEADDFFRKQGQRSWNPAVMLNFTDHLLSLIRQVCSANPGFTIRVFYSPSDSCVRAFMKDRPGSGLSMKLGKLKGLSSANGSGS